MKRIILLLAIAGFVMHTQGQKPMAKEVPEAVTAAAPATTTATDISEPVTPSTDISEPVTPSTTTYTRRQIPHSICVTDKCGNVSLSVFPAPVIEYVKLNYKEEEVKKASRFYDANGTLTFVAEVNGMDLIFDSKGNFIKSEKK